MRLRGVSTGKLLGQKEIAQQADHIGDLQVAIQIAVAAFLRDSRRPRRGDGDRLIGGHRLEDGDLPVGPLDAQFVDESRASDPEVRRELALAKVGFSAMHGTHPGSPSRGRDDLAAETVRRESREVARVEKHP